MKYSDDKIQEMLNAVKFGWIGQELLRSLAEALAERQAMVRQLQRMNMSACTCITDMTDTVVKPNPNCGVHNLLPAVALAALSALEKGTP